MPLFLFAPVGIWLGRTVVISLGLKIFNFVVDKKYDSVIGNASSCAKNFIKRYFLLMISRTILEIFSNIVLLLISIYYFKNTFYIGIVLCASVLYSSVKFFSGTLFKLWSFIVDCKFNFREFIAGSIRGEVFTQVSSEFKDMNIFKRGVMWITGRDKHTVTKDIIDNTITLYYGTIIIKIIILALLSVGYVILFRWLILPRILEENIGLNFYETLSYPFLWSLDRMYDWRLINQFYPTLVGS